MVRVLTLGAIVVASLAGCAMREMTLEDAAQIQPTGPRQLVAERGDEGIELTWNDPGGDMVCFEILRAVADEELEVIACVEPAGDRLGDQRFVDRSPPDGPLRYGVRVVDQFGSQSRMAEAELDAP